MVHATRGESKLTNGGRYGLPGHNAAECDCYQRLGFGEIATYAEYLAEGKPGGPASQIVRSD